jgi:hypothetical protein
MLIRLLPAQVYTTSGNKIWITCLEAAEETGLFPPTSEEEEEEAAL